MDQRALDFIRRTLDEKYSYRFKWMGQPIIQLAPDVLAIQELIWSIRPHYIVEIGVAHGGLTLFCASMLELMDHGGYVIAVEVALREENRQAIEDSPVYNSIILIDGDSTDENVVAKVKRMIEPSARVLVILDSNHTHDHVLQELLLYSPLVSIGSYIIVMDTVIEYLPPDSFPGKPWGVGDNPLTAVRQFLENDSDFDIDYAMDDRVLISSAPEGYLRRVK